MKNIAVLLILACSFACLTKPQRGEPGSSPMEERVQVLELKVTDNLEQINQKIQALENRVKELEAELESDKVKDGSDGESELISEDGTRDGGSETIEAIEKSSSAPTSDSEVDSQAAGRLYQTALQSYRQKEYEKALEGFESFASQYPEHKLTPNAFYWEAEVYYDKKDYEQARNYLQKVVQSFPGSPKAPDALLKLALLSERIKDAEGVRSYVEKLKQTYPFSNAAGKVDQLLNTLPPGP